MNNDQLFQFWVTLNILRAACAPLTLVGTLVPRVLDRNFMGRLTGCCSDSASNED